MSMMRLRTTLQEMRRSGAFLLVARSARGESGLSLAEVVVAMGIFLVVLLGLVLALTRGFLDIGLARQRQSATGIANRLIEEVRGLPQTSLERGIDTSNAAIEAANPEGRIRDCGGNPVVYKLGECADPNSEEIIHSSGLPSTPPLVPHVERIEPDTTNPLGTQIRTSYTRRVYVTHALDVPASGAFRVTVVVDMDSPLRGGVSPTTQVQSLISFPAGCADKTTHPFAAPCESFFYGSAIAPTGNFTVTGIIRGMPSFQQATFGVAGSRSDMQLEQINRLNGEVRSPGATLTTDSSSQVGSDVASSLADDDTGTAIPAYDSQALALTSGETVSQTEGATTISIRTEGGSSGVSTSAISPDATNSCPQGTGAPAPEVDGAPCGYSQMSVLGRVTAAINTTLTEPVTGQTVPINANLTRVSVASTATPGSAFTDRFVSATDARVLARAKRTISEMDLLALPTTLITLPAWLGFYVRLNSYSDQTDATVGTSAGPPTASVASGSSIEYWNGLGYGTLAVTATPSVIPVAPFDFTVPDTGIRIQMSGALSTGGTSVNETCSVSPCPTGSGTRTDAEARSNSPIVGTVTYVITDSTGEAINLTVNVDLGQAVSRGIYRLSG